MNDAPPNPMTRRFEISIGEKTFVIIVDQKDVTIREMGKAPIYKTSWTDVIEFVMQQKFFTFTK